jgi:hypothetical protein
MACNACETSFQSYQTIVVSILKSGANALLYLQNQGRNIAYIRRILICYALPGGGSGVLYLRPPGQPISWSYPSDTLETGITALFYQLNGLAAGTIVQAQAEYVEIEDRSRSCAFTI